MCVMIISEGRGEGGGGWHARQSCFVNSPSLVTPEVESRWQVASRKTTPEKQPRNQPLQTTFRRPALLLLHVPPQPPSTSPQTASKYMPQSTRRPMRMIQDWMVTATAAVFTVALAAAELSTVAGKPITFFDLPNLQGNVQELSESEWKTLDPVAFHKEYATGWGKPVVFRGMAKQHPAYERWQSDEAMAKEYGDLSLQCEGAKEETRQADDIEVTISEFIEKYRNGDMYAVSNIPLPMRKVRREIVCRLWPCKTRSFVSSCDPTPPHPVQDIAIVDLLRCSPAIKFMSEILMWWSSGGTKSVMHNDNEDNLNCVISGDKRLALFHPARKVRVLVHSPASRTWWRGPHQGSCMAHPPSYPPITLHSLDAAPTFLLTPHRTGFRAGKARDGSMSARPSLGRTFHTRARTERTAGESASQYRRVRRESDVEALAPRAATARLLSSTDPGIPIPDIWANQTDRTAFQSTISQRFRHRCATIPVME